MFPKLYVGPMSREVIDAAISAELPIGLIPSRRQVDYNSGYVLQSDGFTRYVRRKTPKIILQRDHGGPKQGARDDDGIESLVEDCRNKFELIHIDPWKKFKDIDAAAGSTTHLISTALEANKSCLFEVGTEEAIRKYSPLELEYFLNKLKNDLGEKFNSIKFAVIQSGVGLMGVSNIGNFDEQRCKDMISVCKDFNLLSKEHNGDYLQPDLIKRRFELGLDGINIAPELAVEQTREVVKQIKNKKLAYELFNACLKYKFWVKWLPEGFEAEDEYSRRLLVEVSCHYIYQSPEFKDICHRSGVDIRSTIPKLEDKIKSLHESCCVPNRNDRG